MVAVHADGFSSIQSGKGNKTADWVACGASKSLSCRPWEAASSQAPNGWVPDEGTLSGSPRFPFLLKANERLFHTRRTASLIEAALLSFDRSFDFFNLPSRRLSPLRLSRPGADWIFILLACAERALYSDTSGGDATLRKGYWFWQSSGILQNLERRLRMHVRLGGFRRREHVPMNRKELYLSYAADCQQMAYVTRNEHERLIWLDMAQSWLQLAQVSSASLESQLDKSRRNAA
jgi:hypothetical protein